MAERRPNFVFLMTDTQRADMVGCYGRPAMGTPHLDRLAAEGVRFDRAYTSCPLCSPARAGIFTGQAPSNAGPSTNNIALGQNVHHMGEYFAAAGYDTAYIGKWHLDGHDYFDTGLCPAGWDERYWYDGKRYLADLRRESQADGRDLVDLWRQGLKSAEDLESAGITAEFTWAHRISDRAIDYLSQQPYDRPFLLVASYDEPHGPFTCPPEYVRRFEALEFDLGPAASDDLSDKPDHLQQWAGQREPNRMLREPMFFGCNSFVDAEIGRVIDAALARDDRETWIIYTSDHGDLLGAHRIRGKGPAMFEEIARIPLLIRSPGGGVGAADATVVSHLDLLPTMLDLAGVEPPPIFHGDSLVGRLREPDAPEDRSAFIEFTRFAINHDGWGGYVPIRALVRGGWKLVINLLSDRDELYHLADDPHELTNRIDGPDAAAVRNALHDELLERMAAQRDPHRGPAWGRRPWRTDRTFSFEGQYRNRPDDGFSPPVYHYWSGKPTRPEDEA